MFKGKTSGMAITVILLLVPILMLACGGGDASAGLSSEEVQKIVREELAAAPPAETGLTRAEVEEAIQGAITAMPEPEPGLTRAEVEEAIRTAVAAMPKPEQGLTTADVEDAIRAAMTTMPQPDPGVTAAEVQNLIQAAIGDLPQPEPALTIEEAKRLAQYAVATIPSKYSPAEYTKFFVNNAINRYELEGLEAALTYYNRVDSIDGQWYVFIVDENDLTIAHPNGSLIGLDLKGPLGTDANGYNFGQEMLSAGEEGRWVSYVYGNPATRSIGTAFGELQLKNAWVVRHGGLLFGSGWYVDADEFTKSFVAAAVGKFRAVGLEGTVEYFTGSESDFAGLPAAIDYYNSIDTVEGEWSAFIADGNGRIVDHNDKELVGRDLEDLFGVAMFEASPEGNWVTTESLRIWVVSYDGLVFGSGWHHDESG